MGGHGDRLVVGMRLAVHAGNGDVERQANDRLGVSIAGSGLPKAGNVWRMTS